MVVGWALLADAVAFYPLYALFFAAHGMSAAQISALFAIWSLASVAVEVPSGALADRLPRRTVLAAGGAVQALGYATWLLVPTFPGFAAGFVLWGIGTSLYSGTVEALLFEELTARGRPQDYARWRGRVTAAGHAAQVPAAAAASLLVAAGGYDLVGWVSVATCMAAAALTAAFPDPPRTGPPPGDEADDGAGYLALLRAGLAEALVRPAVRGVLLAAALVGGVDALEEYFPLVVGGAEGVGGAVDGAGPGALAAVPPLLLVVALAGAAGAACGERARRLAPAALGGLLAVAGAGLTGSALVPAAIPAAPSLLGAGATLAGLALFYGLQQAVLVAVDARLQERLSGSARATATSVGTLGTEFVALALFATWAFGGAAAAAVAVLAAAGLLWLLLRHA